MIVIKQPKIGKIILRTKRNNNSIVVLLLEFMAFFSPMGATPFGINFGVGQLSIFRFFFFCGAIIFGLKKIVGIQCCRFYKESLRTTLMLFIWLMYAIISALWIYDINGYFRSLFFLCVGITLSIILTEACTCYDIEKIMKSFNLGFLVQAFIGLYEHLTGDYRFVSDYTLNFYTSRGYRYPIAMMFNPNDFSTGMFFAMMISIYFLLKKRNSIICKILYTLMIMLYSYLIFVGGSRAVLIGVVFALSFIIIYGQRKTTKVFIVCSLVLVLLLPSTMQTIISHLDLSYFQTKGESFSIRSNLIKNGFDFLLNSYGFGVGNGQIEYWMDKFAAYPVKNIQNMHNFWIEMLTQYGILIFIGLIVFYTRITYGFYKMYKKNTNNQNRLQSLILTGTLIGYIFVSISSSSNLSKEYVWLFLAICIALYNDLKILENDIRDSSFYYD